MCFKNHLVMAVVFPSVSDVKQLVLSSPCCRYMERRKWVIFLEISLWIFPWGHFWRKTIFCVIFILGIPYFIFILAFIKYVWMRNIYERRKVVSGRFLWSHLLIFYYFIEKWRKTISNKHTSCPAEGKSGKRDILDAI